MENYYQVLSEEECTVPMEKLAPPEQNEELSMAEILRALPGISEELAVILEAERRGFNNEQMDMVVDYCRQIAKERYEKQVNGFGGKEDPYAEVIPWDEIQSLYSLNKSNESEPESKDDSPSDSDK